MLLRMILALMVMVLFMPISVYTVKQLSFEDEMDQTIQDQIALIQLRRDMILSSDIRVVNGTAVFCMDEDERYFEIVNGQLVMRPGYVMYMSEVDGAVFFIENEVLKVRYARGEKEYVESIAAITKDGDGVLSDDPDGGMLDERDPYGEADV